MAVSGRDNAVGSAKAFCRACACFQSLHLSVAERSVRDQRIEQLLGDLRNAVHGTVESFFIALEGLVKPLNFRTN
jgi:hypothetical protein